MGVVIGDRSYDASWGQDHMKNYEFFRGWVTASYGGYYIITYCKSDTCRVVDLVKSLAIYPSMVIIPRSEDTEETQMIRCSFDGMIFRFEDEADEHSFIVRIGPNMNRPQNQYYDNFYDFIL